MVRLFLTLLLVGCYKPIFVDCTVACGPGGDCPEGLTCQDQMCVKPRSDLVACGPSPNRQLTVGAAHACLVRYDSTLWCWGANDQGQIGDGTSMDRTTPTIVARNTGWASVSAGASHTCALRRDGSAWCWGANPDGQLGTGDMDPHPTPMPVASKETWTTISAASDRTCGTQSDGSVWCWGRGNPLPSQVKAPNVGPVAFVATGDDQLLCMLSHDRSLACPSPVGGEFEKISAGSAHFCAIDSTSGLFCSGADDSGQIGDAMTAAMSMAKLGSGFVQVSAGAAQTCAIRSSGALACWGKNDVGQLGDGTSDGKSSPTPIGSDSDWLLVQTGATSTCGVHDNGRVQCWGSNDRGQIGDGTMSPRPVPTDVAF